MLMYWRELTVAWGESDPFGLVYYPRMLAWVNDTEHDLFRALGYPIDEMIRKDRTTFVMGEIHFRFIGPAAYGDRIRCIMTLAKTCDMMDRVIPPEDSRKALDRLEAFSKTELIGQTVRRYLYLYERDIARS